MWRYFNHKIVQWCWTSWEADLITEILNEYYIDQDLKFESVYQHPSSGGQTAYLVMIHEDLLNDSCYEMYDIRKVMVNTLARQLRKVSNELAMLKHQFKKIEADAS